ncbi:MAG: hypothetical protein ABI295_12210 [Xanthomarina sp.]
MTKILIERNSEWNNKARAIGIYIDGQKVGTINDGEKKEYVVAPGLHEVYAKTDWCRSQKIALNTIENETTTLKLTGYKHKTWVSAMGLGVLFFYFLGKYALNIDLTFLVGFAIIGFLYPLYFITFGKNSYLKLSDYKMLQ